MITHNVRHRHHLLCFVCFSCMGSSRTSFSLFFLSFFLFVFFFEILPRRANFLVGSRAWTKCRKEQQNGLRGCRGCARGGPCTLYGAPAARIARQTGLTCAAAVSGLAYCTTCTRDLWRDRGHTICKLRVRLYWRAMAARRGGGGARPAPQTPDAPRLSHGSRRRALNQPVHIAAAICGPPSG